MSWFLPFCSALFRSRVQSCAALSFLAEEFHVLPDFLVAGRFLVQVRVWVGLALVLALVLVFFR
jgi:hypothetical protein